MKQLRLIFLFISLAINVIAQENALFKSYPGGAEKCYGRAMISYKHETIEERVLVRPSYTRVQEVPPVYEAVTENILVEPAYKTYEVKPPVFDITTTQVEIRKAESYTTSTDLNAQGTYDTLTEKIEVFPAYQRWERTKHIKDCKPSDKDDCLEWQLVDVPAEYVTVQKLVLVLPSTATPSVQDVVSKPAEYQTVTKKTLVKPAEMRVVDVPAKYVTITRYVLKMPRRFEQITTPAEYKTITRYIPIRDGGVLEAIEVVCPEDYPKYISRLQEKLNELGYEAGEVTGTLTRKTKNAITKYQQDKDLPIGQLDFSTIKSLDLVK